MNASRKRRDVSASHGKRFEWAVGAVAFVIVVVLLGYLLGLGTASGRQPPHFSITAGDVVRVGTGYQMQVVVTNEGDETAADVTLRAVLHRDAGEEARELRFDFVPQRSTRRGTLIFEQDPGSRSAVRLSVSSYVEP